MKFPAYWTRVRNSRGTITARGWSDQSLAQAAEHAQQRLQRIRQALVQHRVRELERYVYEVDQAICEEVIERIIENDSELAVISRNAYGSLILNARRMMFIDIDLPAPARRGWFASWFVKAPAASVTPLEQMLQRVRQWQAEHPAFTLRLYRTFAGVRAIVVNQSFETVDASTLMMMRGLGCDELYMRLCQSQGCFRARLTPKPWRVGMPNPPKKFPFDNEAERQAFEKWYQQKTLRSERFKVCEQLQTLGSGEWLAEHRRLIEIHDGFCCKPSDLPLA